MDTQSATEASYTIDAKSTNEEMTIVPQKWTIHLPTPLLIKLSKIVGPPRHYEGDELESIIFKLSDVLHEEGETPSINMIREILWNKNGPNLVSSHLKTWRSTKTEKEGVRVEQSPEKTGATESGQTEAGSSGLKEFAILAIKNGQEIAGVNSKIESVRTELQGNINLERQQFNERLTREQQSQNERLARELQSHQDKISAMVAEKLLAETKVIQENAAKVSNQYFKIIIILVAGVCFLVWHTTSQNQQNMTQKNVGVTSEIKTPISPMVGGQEPITQPTATTPEKKSEEVKPSSENIPKTEPIKLEIKIPAEPTPNTL